MIVWGACFVSILILVFWLRIQGVERIPDGQFTGNDAYLYYKQAETIAEQGYLPARDMERWLPLGRDNGQLVTAQMQPTVTDVTAWELPEGAIARLGRGCLWHISFSPDGRSLAAATTIGCWLYDLPTLTPLALFETERGMLQRIAFSRDAQWIATGNVDGIVKVWNTQTLQCITNINYRGNMGGSSVRTLHFSEDAQYLAVSNHGRSAVYTWRTDANEPLLRFPIDAEDTKGQIEIVNISYRIFMVDMFQHSSRVLCVI